MKNTFEITEDTLIDLYNHFNETVKFSNEEYAMLEKCFYPLIVRKGDHVFVENTIPQYGAYIQKGCVRYYNISDDGTDHTIEFFTEGGCVSDCSATMHSAPVQYYAEALEDCELVCLNHDHYKFLSQNCYPFLQFYIIKKELQARKQINHFLNVKSKTAPDRYLEILKTRPELLLRVPQHHIASYIGVHSRSLSRLKREILDSETVA
jgi:CRP/FNR family transcriptional regulator